MRWPQFELWRLFAAPGFFGGAVACFLAIFQVENIALVGLVSLSAAIGTPFKRGLVCALCLPTAFLLVVAILSVVVELFL